MDTQCVKCKELSEESGYFVYDVEGRLVIGAFGCEAYTPLQEVWKYMCGSPHHKISDQDVAVVTEEENRINRIL